MLPVTHLFVYGEEPDKEAAEAQARLSEADDGVQENTGDVQTPFQTALPGKQKSVETLEFQRFRDKCRWYPQRESGIHGVTAWPWPAWRWQGC